MPLTQTRPARTAGFCRLAIAEIRRETADAVSLAFAVPPDQAKAFRFIPGQYLTLRTWIDGAEIRRSYSICSGLDDGELRVAIKHVRGGLFSGFVHERLQPGDAIEVMPPAGRFTLEPDPRAARAYVAFAAGSGITPVLAIAKSALWREPLSRFFLFYGNRSRETIMFRDALSELKDRFLGRLSVAHVLSREQHDVALLNGRIDAVKVAALMRTAPRPDTIDRAFVCGPGDMIESTQRALLRLGLPAERIGVERFIPAEGPRGTAAMVMAEAAAPPAAVAAVVLNGVHSEVPVRTGETILEAGLRAGLDMPFSCRGGMCCTCRARLLAGEVAMARNYSLTPAELAAGYVLTCQSRPTTPRVAVDYDQR